MYWDVDHPHIDAKEVKDTKGCFEMNFLPAAQPMLWEGESSAVASCRVLLWHIGRSDGPWVLEVGVYGKAVTLHLPISWHLYLQDLPLEENNRQ